MQATGTASRSKYHPDGSTLRLSKLRSGFDFYLYNSISVLKLESLAFFIKILKIKISLENQWFGRLLYIKNVEVSGTVRKEGIRLNHHWSQSRCAGAIGFRILDLGLRI